MAPAEPVLAVRGLGKTYPDGTEALREVTLEVPYGQLVAVIGPSGAGKSTLLRCVNRLTDPTRGQVVVGGRDVTRARHRQLRLARRDIGMVFQHFHLVERLPAIRNVLHGRLGYTGSVAGALGSFGREDVERAMEIMARVGLADQAFKRCAELSGGQKQRVGIARAVMQGARLLLADEPIASLDPSASETVMRILKEVVVAEQVTTVVNLHQVEYAREFADRIVGLRDGEVRCDVPAGQLDDAMVRDLYYREALEPVAGS